MPDPLAPKLTLPDRGSPPDPTRPDYPQPVPPREFRAPAADHPTSAAWSAAAARAVKAGKSTEAADFLARARQAAEPGVFRLVLLDPIFSAESWRPELAATYAEIFPQSSRPVNLPPTTFGKDADVVKKP